MTARSFVKLGLIVIPLFFLLGIILTVFKFNKGLVDVERGLDAHYETIASANQMLNALEGENSAMLMIINGSWDDGRKFMETYDSAFYKGFKLAQISVYDEETKSLAEGIEKEYAQLTKLWFKPILGDSDENTVNWYKDVYYPNYESVKYSLEQFRYISEDRFYNLSERYVKVVNQWFYPLYISFVVSLAFVIFMAFFIFRN